MQAAFSLGSFLSAWLVVVVGLPQWVAAEPQENQAVLKEIEVAWRQRLEKAGSARLTYVRESRVLKIVFMADDAEERPIERSEEERERLSREYFRLNRRGSISIDGPRLRLKTIGQQPTHTGKFIPKENYNVTDGKQHQSLVMHTGIHRFPMGHAWPSARSSAHFNSGWQPLFWTFIPFEPELSIMQLSELSIASASETVDGRRCLLLRKIGTSGMTMQSYWLDPARDYSVIRFMVGTERRPQMQIGCSYSRHASGVWLPVEWTVTAFQAPGMPIKSAAKTRITRYELNPAFDDEEFMINFPPGTLVADRRPEEAEQYGQSTRFFLYIIREDGSRRIVTPEEQRRNVPYERLLETPSGMGHLSDEEIAARTGRFPWLWTGGGTGLALLVGATGWVVYRGRRRKKQESARQQA